MSSKTHRYRKKKDVNSLWEEKLRKRRARFGTVTKPVMNQIDRETAVITNQTLKEGTEKNDNNGTEMGLKNKALSEWEEKLKKRLARFGTVVNPKISEVGMCTKKACLDSGKSKSPDFCSEEIARKSVSREVLEPVSNTVPRVKKMPLPSPIEKRRITSEISSLAVQGETVSVNLKGKQEPIQNRSKDQSAGFKKNKQKVILGNTKASVVSKIYLNKTIIDMDEDNSTSREKLRKRTRVGGGAREVNKLTKKVGEAGESVRESCAKKWDDEDPTKGLVSNSDKELISLEKGNEKNEAGVIKQGVQGMNVSTRAKEVKPEHSWKLRRKDRLERFGTVEDPKIEQPFQPIKSARKGDNTKPLWRDGRVRS